MISPDSIRIESCAEAISVLRLFCWHEMAQGRIVAPKFLERDRFDLANSFARDAEYLTGFLKRVARLLSNAKAHADDFFFAGRERRQKSLHSAFECCVDNQRLRIGGMFVPDHVRQAALTIFTQWDIQRD